MESKLDSFLRGVIIFSATYFSIGFCDIIGNSINCYRNIKILRNCEVITQESEAIKIFNSEKSKLELGSMDLELVISKDLDCPGNSTIKDNSYIINIKRENLSKEVIRHELYHLFRWKNGYRNFSLPIFRQYEEYLATSYSVLDE